MATRTLTLKPETLSTREGDDGSLTLTGLAVPWNDPIVYGGVEEQFARGAIDPDSVVGTPLLWSHDTAEPIGALVAARDIEEGLEIEATVQPTTRGRDAILLLRSGTPMGLSVGFTPIEQKATPTGVVYTRAEMAELSTTPLPAYAKAQVSAVRAEEVKESEMDNATETRESAVDLAPINERIDQIEARMAEPRTTVRRTVGVREAFALQLADFAKTKQMRALADVLSSGNAGILPEQWDTEVLGYVDSMRYMIGQAGSATFPSSGTVVNVPRITQHTLVDPRGTEKADPPTRALTTEAAQFSVEWYAGAVDVAMELIEQSNPPALSVIATDLLRQYAARTDAAATAACVAAATHHGAVLDTTSYAGLIADVIGVGEAIRAATGEFGNRLSLTTADWTAVLGLVDGDDRRIFSTTGSSNADGSARLDAPAVDIGGVVAFHNPRANTSVQFNQTSFRVAEKPPVSLQQQNVSLLGVDLGVLGAIVNMPLYTDGIVSYEV